MHERLQVMLDSTSTLDDAQANGAIFIDVLTECGLVSPHLESDCVPGGDGFPPGERVHEYFPYWNELKARPIGVKLCIRNYANRLALSEIEQIKCPSCSNWFRPDSGISGHQAVAIIQQLSESIAPWAENRDITDITCPQCEQSTGCTEWATLPPLGYCDLALEFWNWPSFHHGGWTFQSDANAPFANGMPSFINIKTGREVLMSWG